MVFRFAQATCWTILLVSCLASPAVAYNAMIDSKAGPGVHQPVGRVNWVPGSKTCQNNMEIMGIMTQHCISDMNFSWSISAEKKNRRLLVVILHGLFHHLLFLNRVRFFFFSEGAFHCCTSLDAANLCMQGLDNLRKLPASTHSTVLVAAMPQPPRPEIHWRKQEQKI